MFQLIEFVKDLAQSDEETFFERYYRKVPKNLLIQDFMSFIESKSLLESFVDREYFDGAPVTRSVYLIPALDGLYEFSTVELGMRHNVIRCELFEDVQRVIEEYLHRLGHDPVDVKYC